MNDRQVFETAGVSMEEAKAAKEVLLDRLYDFLDDPDHDPEEFAERLAHLRDDISQIMDPNFPLFGLDNIATDKREGFQAFALAALAQSTAEVPGLALSLHDMSRLSGVQLEMLESAYMVIRPDLYPEDTAPQANKSKKKASGSRQSGVKKKKKNR